MKKNILTTIVSLSIAIFAAIGINVNLSQKNSQNYLTLENIEALAMGEGSGGRTCYYDYYYTGGNSGVLTCTNCIFYQGYTPVPGGRTGRCN